MNNNQINNENETYLNFIEAAELIIFNFDDIGYCNNVCDIIVYYLVMIHNVMSDEKVYTNCGNVFGLNFNNKIISIFEKLSFIDKIDVISELIIRYYNKTYFNELLEVVSFDS